MSLCLARVDDRLIHGQVIHGWVPYLRIDVVIVADEQAAASEDQQMIARMAIPDNVTLAFVKPAEAYNQVQALNNKNVLLLFRTPIQAWEAIQAGMILPSLNLGNCHFEPGKLQLRKTFCCSNKELSALRKIAASGVEINYQPAPDLKRTEVDLGVPPVI